MKRLIAFLLIITLSACLSEADIPTLPTNTDQQTSTTSQTEKSSTPTIALKPTRTPQPQGIQPQIYCGENLQLMGTLVDTHQLTLFKANGLEYFQGETFFSGNLVGEVSIFSVIRGTNLRMANNEFTEETICFVGYEDGDSFTGIMLPQETLLNERRFTEDFEGTILLDTPEETVEMEWVTYRITSSSNKDCLLYKIIKNPYPCRQDCEELSEETGCSCFCANFLFYDEHCVATEINPDCVCICRD